MSFSDMAGTDTGTPGRLIPLWLLTVPPTITVVWTSLPSTESTRSRTLPSSIRMSWPGITSPGSPSYVVPQMAASPRMSRVVIVNRSPGSIVSLPSWKLPSRIFGPWRSAKMPTPWPVASDAARIRR